MTARRRKSSKKPIPPIRKKLAGRKSLFPGAAVGLTVLMPVAARAVLLRKAAALTEQYGYPISLGNAIVHCVYEACGEPLPANNLHRATIRSTPLTDTGATHDSIPAAGR